MPPLSFLKITLSFIIYRNIFQLRINSTSIFPFFFKSDEKNSSKAKKRKQMWLLFYAMVHQYFQVFLLDSQITFVVNYSIFLWIAIIYDGGAVLSRTHGVEIACSQEYHHWFQ